MPQQALYWVQFNLKYTVRALKHIRGSLTNVTVTAVYVKWVQVYLNTMFKVQGGTADGDNLSLPVDEGILLSLGWSIWLQVYADSIGDRVSREYGGLSGVCRSRLSYGGIHKHLLEKKERGSCWTRHDKRRQWAHQSHWRVGCSVRCWSQTNKHKKKKKKDGRSCHLNCVSLPQRRHNFDMVYLPVYCFNRGEMLKTRLATLNLCED